MLNRFSLGFQGLHPSKNLCFSLEVGQDLFGAWSIITRRGPKLMSGRTKRYVELDKPKAQERVRKLLSRTLTLDASPPPALTYMDLGEEENVFSWIPMEKLSLQIVKF